MPRLLKFKSVLANARSLRGTQTSMESRLWRELRGRRFDGFKFRRQQPIGPYIADFCCFEAKLTIELDGGGHAHKDVAAYDRRRTEYMRSLGLRELRFWNNDITDNLEAVLSTIEKAITGENSPSPPVGEGRAKRG